MFHRCQQANSKYKYTTWNWHLRKKPPKGAMKHYKNSLVNSPGFTSSWSLNQVNQVESSEIARFPIESRSLVLAKKIKVRELLALCGRSAHAGPCDLEILDIEGSATNLVVYDCNIYVYIYICVHTCFSNMFIFRCTYTWYVHTDCACMCVYIYIYIYYACTS